MDPNITLQICYFSSVELFQKSSEKSTRFLVTTNQSFKLANIKEQQEELICCGTSKFP